MGESFATETFAKAVVEASKREGDTDAILAALLEWYGTEEDHMHFMLLGQTIRLITKLRGNQHFACEIDESAGLADIADLDALP